MAFTHDTDVALQSAAALVNTQAGPESADPTRDDLRSLDDLRAFWNEWEYSGPPPTAPADVAPVQALRPRLRELWHADEARVVEIVNDLLAESQALPQLVKHDQWDYHLHATRSDAPVSQRMAVEAAMALVDVVRAGELSRLRICAGEDCDNVVVDLSRNRSRRFCDHGCGNKANVAAYRARQGQADRD
ncbi:CGNR zinc finger domain-containing protein [Kribbia dieselivorans]|uniref:CGNR zinc finger domain-containing protein n=1 Tax=Kribbia dieselivorans TaxID=331526 RepID=UPI000839898D|nr:CGNR zinc finger domain-containing protein [Kribbia dieselivorans]